MPAGYMGALSTAQANGPRVNNGLGSRPTYDAGAGRSFTPGTPWSNYSYSGSYANKYGDMLGAGHTISTPKIGDYSYDNHGGTGYYMYGPQGYGVYRQGSPEQQLMSEQQYNTNKFIQDMPTTADQLGHQANQSISAQMDQGIQNTRQRNSNRGLLYGGLNQGQEHGVRGQAVGQMAQARSGINSGLIQEGQKMQQQTANTGISYQQMQQSLNNAIYENAMKSFAANGAIAGDVIGAVGAIVGTIYGGSAGGQAGYAGGKAAGNALS